MRYPTWRETFHFKYLPDISGEIIILFYFSCKNIAEGSYFILSLHYVALKDISGVLCAGLKASSKYRYLAHSLQRRCMALTPFCSPGEVIPLNSSHRRAWNFCVKINLGHIYTFQYLLSKVIFLCKRCLGSLSQYWKWSIIPTWNKGLE